MTGRWSGRDARADLVFVGGAVYTVDASRRWAEAVAIRDGRIVAVGSDADVLEGTEPKTEVVNLRGQMLLPGFQDAHVHTPVGGLELLRCDLSGSRSRLEYGSTIAAYADAHPELQWIIGRGWSMEEFPGGTPTRQELDTVISDRPVFLLNRDGHGAWVNSLALELAGIDRDTPDPPDGRIERDADELPSGTLHEGAKEPVRHLAPEPTPADLKAGLLAGQTHLHSLGITSWQDAGVGKGLHGLDTFPVYVEMARSGQLTARVVGSLWWERDGNPNQIESFIDLRSEAVVGRFRAGTVKIMQDGVVEDFTAAMLQPYLDGSGEKTNNFGHSFIPAEALKEYVVLLDREGFQVHLHAIGDRAVRESLDAIESARRANGMNDNRHHIAHIQLIHPDDIARFRSLGTIANAQPLWAVFEPQMTELTIPFLGPERSAWQYPFRSLNVSGAVLALGSDWPVSSANPLWGIHSAVNRTTPREQSTDERPATEAFLPEEAIDLPAAIAAYTMGSAYTNHLEHETGSIEEGKLADLVVLDRNVFREPASEIADARVVLTLVEGEVVFDGLGL